MGKLYSDLKLAHVSGRGYGKTARAQAYIESQSGELVPIGVVDNGISFGPIDAKEDVLYSYTNYEAQMKFEAEFTITREDMVKMFDRGRLPYYSLGVLGSWDYTPRDELRDRLNDWLQGKQPAAAVNTRYWRGL